MDWTAFGTAIAGILSGIGLVWAKGKIIGSAARAEVAANDAEASVITTLRAEFDRLALKVELLEGRCDKYARRIWQLEAELARHGMPVPPEGA